jgi:hypothetical protein
VGVGTAGWWEPVHVTQFLLEHPGAEQDVAGAAQPDDGVALAVGPARWVFEQRPAGVVDQLRGGVLADPGQRSGTGHAGGAAGGVPGGAADFVHGGVGELDDVEGVRPV